jgi:hypothetical protein
MQVICASVKLSGGTTPQQLQVLSLLALLVHKYKYGRSSFRCGGTTPQQLQVLSLLALLVHKYKYGRSGFRCGGTTPQQLQVLSLLALLVHKVQIRTQQLQVRWNHAAAASGTDL